MLPNPTATQLHAPYPNCCCCCCFWLLLMLAAAFRRRATASRGRLKDFLPQASVRFGHQLPISLSHAHSAKALSCVPWPPRWMTCQLELMMPSKWRLTKWRLQRRQPTRRMSDANVYNAQRATCNVRLASPPHRNTHTQPSMRQRKTQKPQLPKCKSSLSSITRTKFPRKMNKRNQVRYRLCFSSKRTRIDSIFYFKLHFVKINLILLCCSTFRRAYFPYW